MALGTPYVVDARTRMYIALDGEQHDFIELAQEVLLGIVALVNPLLVEEGLGELAVSRVDRG